MIYYQYERGDIKNLDRLRKNMKKMIVKIKMNLKSLENKKYL